MKFSLCQNDRNEKYPKGVSFPGISCNQLKVTDQTPDWKYFISTEMKSHVNTLFI